MDSGDQVSEIPAEYGKIANLFFYSAPCSEQEMQYKWTKGHICLLLGRKQLYRWWYPCKSFCNSWRWDRKTSGTVWRRHKRRCFPSYWITRYIWQYRGNWESFMLIGCPRKWHFGIPRNTEVISGSIPAKSLQKSKNSAEFRVGGIPWTPYMLTINILNWCLENKGKKVSYSVLWVTDSYVYTGVQRQLFVSIFWTTDEPFMAPIWRWTMNI